MFFMTFMVNCFLESSVSSAFPAALREIGFFAIWSPGLFPG